MRNIKSKFSWKTFIKKISFLYLFSMLVYLILDTSVLKQIAEKGYASIEEHYGIWKDNRQFFMEFNMPTDTDELIERENTPIDYTTLLEGAVGTGVVFKGNTLEELATKMGVDVETFVDRVNQYN